MKRDHMITCPCCGYERTELTKKECTKLEKKWAPHRATQDLLQACSWVYHAIGPETKLLSRDTCIALLEAALAKAKGKA